MKSKEEILAKKEELELSWDAYELAFSDAIAEREDPEHCKAIARERNRVAEKLEILTWILSDAK